MIFPDNPTAVLRGHSGAVHCAIFSAGQGQYVLTGCADRTVRLFNPAKAEGASDSTASVDKASGSGSSVPGLIQSYSAHGYGVLDIAVTDDNARFASVGGDRQVFLWDVAASKTLRRWSGHGGQINCVAFGGPAGEVCVSGSYDATVKLWDCRSQSFKPIQTLDEARDSVASLRVSGHEVVAGSVDGRVRTYDLRQGLVFTDTVGQAVTSVQLTRDGETVLVSTLDSVIRLLDRGNGKLLQSYRGHRNENFRVRSALGLGDAVAVSGSEDGCIYAWDLLEGRVLKKIEAHGGKVASCVAFNGLRREWVSAGTDGTAVVWGMRP